MSIITAHFVFTNVQVETRIAILIWDGTLYATELVMQVLVARKPGEGFHTYQSASNVAPDQAHHGWHPNQLAQH